MLQVKRREVSEASLVCVRVCDGGRDADVVSTAAATRTSEGDGSLACAQDLGGV